MSKLNDLQMSALNAVSVGLNVFLTGPPGTGKSFVLKEIIAMLKEKDRKIATTSSTGCSAVLIGGQTIHSFLGMGIGNTSCESICTRLKQNKSKFKQIYELQTLIIDEISMIDDQTFEHISNILKKVKDDRRPFGGTQTIFVGDFCQLSPVKGNYCFLTDLWKEVNLVNVNLTELIRQKDDTTFQRILQEIRFGKCSKSTFKILKTLNDSQFKNIVPTKLYSLNVDVNGINHSEARMLYRKLYKTSLKDAKIVKCYPIIQNDDIDMRTYVDDINEKTYDDNQVFRYNALTNDKKIKVEEYEVELFKGLQVMVTRNINFEQGIVNGTLGIVIKATPTSIIIEDVNKKNHVIVYHTDKNDNDKKTRDKTYVKFMPIKIAYALSIHKSQGSTLDCIEVDGSSFIFAPGQLYTALSRAKEMSSIRLVNLDKESFICNKNVKTFYEDIEK